MSVKLTAMSILMMHDDIDGPLDLKVCLKATKLIQHYLDTSNDAVVKLKLRNSSQPIKEFKSGLQAIRFGERTTSLSWLISQEAKFRIYSFSDFNEFLIELSGAGHELHDTEIW